MRERDYQKHVIDILYDLFPGCLIIKNDSTYIQGIPDLLVLYGSNWAMLEVKADSDARLQPNQAYYIEMLDEMSYSAIIHPGNEEAVLDALQSAFGLRGETRVPQS